jgi:hypothetical protein
MVTRPLNASHARLAGAHRPGGAGPTRPSAPITPTPIGEAAGRAAVPRSETHLARRAGELRARVGPVVGGAVVRAVAARAARAHAVDALGRVRDCDGRCGGDDAHEVVDVLAVLDRDLVHHPVR